MYTVSSTKFDDLPGNLPEDRVPHDLDPQSLVDLSQFVKRALEDLRADVLVADALWRDLLAMTGRVQTLSGASNIPQNWSQNSTERHPTDISANDARVSRVAPGSSWVDVPFTFSTKQNRGLAGRCSGTASLIPDNDGKWKMWVLTTVLENFEGHGSPDIPQLKKDTTNGHSINGAQSNLNHETSVVIIGAGQNGLSLAGRLGALGIDYILLERERDVGLSWTNKYESIKQHTNKESNNLPFDRTWKADDPDLLVGAEVAVGFQNYVKRYGINVWTSTVTKDCTWNEQQSGWTLIVERGASVERHTISTRHLGLAMGAGLSIPYVPEWPGAETYKGQLVHASDYKTSRAWKGKTAVVVGCGTTAHDVAQDMLNAGLSSITLTQRSKTSVYPVEWIVKGLGMIYNTEIPTDVADRLSQTMPMKIRRDMFRRMYKDLFEAESARFDALDTAGFKVNRNSVWLEEIPERYGGYYVDVGTSKHVANGDLKVKSGASVVKYTPEGLAFDDGTELKSDVIVLATGYDHDHRRYAASIIGNDRAAKLGDYWGLSPDGEMKGTMEPLAPGLWLLGGALAQARWNSRFIALQIQADLLAGGL